MKRVALVTYSGCPQLTDDDRLLVPALRQRDIEAVPVVWDAPCDWAGFDQVVIRSCWDYHLRADEFLRWIGELDRAHIPLHNSASLVRWNADKRYLRQLQGTGIRIPPTVWIEDGEEVSVQEILEAQNWESAVAKPAVSASAHLLQLIFNGGPVVRVSGPALVQQFIPEIQALGEWSLVFIGGEFSHSVVKLPTPGDFRVQSQFGGTARVAQPRQSTVETVNRIFDSLPEIPLYARVDGIECDSGFVLMELELIEPVLFLSLGGAIERLAAATMNLPTGSKRDSRSFEN